MVEEGGIEGDGTEEVRGDGGFHRDQIGFLTEQVFGTHDAGTVENDVKFGESRGDVGGKRLDCRGIFDIEEGSFKARIGRGDLVLGLLAASSNDYRIAAFVKSFIGCLTNVRASSCT